MIDKKNVWVWGTVTSNSLNSTFSSKLPNDKQCSSSKCISYRSDYVFNFLVGLLTHFFWKIFTDESECAGSPAVPLCLDASFQIGEWNLGPLSIIHPKMLYKCWWEIEWFLHFLLFNEILQNTEFLHHIEGSL